VPTRIIFYAVMGFLFSCENRADSIKILVRNLKIDEPTATNIYDSSRPTMTVDGGLSPDTQKRMVAFFSKITPSKDAADADEVFDFSFLRRAHSTLQARRWKPAS